MLDMTHTAFELRENLLYGSPGLGQRDHQGSSLGYPVTRWACAPIFFETNHMVERKRECRSRRLFCGKDGGYAAGISHIPALYSFIQQHYCVGSRGVSSTVGPFPRPHSTDCPVRTPRRLP